LQAWKFERCSLKDVDFTEANLQNASLRNSQFDGAIFDRTDLKQADLRDSTGIILNPERNQIQKAKFSLHQASGLLSQYQIILE